MVKDSSTQDCSRSGELGPSAQQDDHLDFHEKNFISNPQDLEATGSQGKAESVKPKITEQTDEDLDPNLASVTWEGADDPANPKNWLTRDKWCVTIIMSTFSMVTLVSSSMIAPALFIISKDLDITSDEETQLSLSSFVLAFAVCPLVLGPLSEIYGRKWILQSSNLWFLLWNIVCGFSRSKGEIIAGRFLSGSGASAIYGVAGGVVGDCWRPEERGKSLGLYSFIPLLGPAIGPIIGGYVAERTTWRWIFWSTSLFDGALQIVAFFFFWETHGPTILHKKANKMRKDTANPDLHTKFEQPDRTPSQILRTGLTRAFMLLATHSIIQIIALYLAYNFGMIYIVLGTFPTLWTERYHQSVASSGLNFISLIIGLTIGSQGGAWFTDRLWRYFEKRGAVAPEDRVLLMLPGAFFVPIGLFCYGWSAQAHTHWIVPNLGIAIFGTGTQLGVQCLQAYIVDTYGQFTASALAAASALRSLSGFGFPLFAPKLYQSLDYGWGNSLLALISITIGFPAPLLIWKYGAAFRARVKSSDLG